MYIAFCSRFNLPCSLVDAFSFYSLVNCFFYFLLGGVLFFPVDSHFSKKSLEEKNRIELE